MLLANATQVSQSEKTTEKYRKNISREVRKGWKDKGRNNIGVFG